MKIRGLLLTALVCTLAGAEEPPRKPTQDSTAEPYGFEGHEIYKIARRISHLTACDADNDGLLDLLVANNSKARIELFLRRKDPVAPKTKTGDPLPNALADDQFFERKEILTEKNVTSLVAEDLNGDGNVDIAYYGKPAELVVTYGDGKGAFGKTVTFPITDGSTSSGALAAVDINGDGRTDLCLLGRGYTAILSQTKKGTLKEPVKIPHEKDISGLDCADLNGDGRVDLVHVSFKSTRPLRVRFQQPDGSLGAELGFRMSPFRVAGFYDVDKKSKGQELLAVQRSSGVLRSYKLAKRKAPSGLGSVQMHAFEETGGSKARSMAIGDVNGDGLLDLAVTEPGNAQVALYLQDKSGRLSGRRVYPSLSNSEHVLVADLDGDGKGEVIVSSSGERAVGVSRYDNGKLPFPTLLELKGTPRTIDAADLDGDKKDDLLIVLEAGKKDFRAVVVRADGRSETKLPVKAASDGALLLDIDRDGKKDLLLFDKYGPMKVLRATEKGFEDLGEGGREYRAGLVRNLSRDAVNEGDLDGDGKPELLVATKNFARGIVLDTSPSGKDETKVSLRVVDQANGATPRSRIQGVVALDVDGDGKPEVALFDKDKKALTLLSRNDAGVLEVKANLDIGDLDLRSMHVADLNGDKRPDIVLMGKQGFGVLYAQGNDYVLEPQHSIESTARDARFWNFDVADMNGSGTPDVVIVDLGNRALQILAYDGEKGFSEKLHFPVYEKKMHGRRGSASAINELVLEDLNHDGMVDVALLIHDRLIVYVQ